MQYIAVLPQISIQTKIYHRLNRTDFPRIVSGPYMCNSTAIVKVKIKIVTRKANKRKNKTMVK